MWELTVVAAAAAAAATVEYREDQLCARGRSGGAGQHATMSVKRERRDGGDRDRLQLPMTGQRGYGFPYTSLAVSRAVPRARGPV